MAAARNVRLGDILLAINNEPLETGK